MQHHLQSKGSFHSNNPQSSRTQGHFPQQQGFSAKASNSWHSKLNQNQKQHSQSRPIQSLAKDTIVHGNAAYGSSELRKYRIEKMIGSGTFGLVYSAVDLTSGERVALKECKQNRPGVGMQKDAIREVSLLKEIRHTNIVKLRDVFIRDLKMFLIFDLAMFDITSVLRYFKTKQEAVPHHIVKGIMQGLLRGLDHLHSGFIMHRDVKPDNILMSPDGAIQLADFGMARFFKDPVCGLWMDGVVVTIWYRAPELLLGAKHYTTAIDIWAAGCIFAELLTCHPLFPGQEHAREHFQQDQVQKIATVLGDPRDSWPAAGEMAHGAHLQGISMENKQYVGSSIERLRTALRNSGQSLAGFNASEPQLLHLLSLMLHYDPAQRITARQALEHEYFQCGQQGSLPAASPPEESIIDKLPEDLLIKALVKPHT